MGRSSFWGNLCLAAAVPSDLSQQGVWCVLPTHILDPSSTLSLMASFGAQTVRVCTRGTKVCTQWYLRVAQQGSHTGLPLDLGVCLFVCLPASVLLLSQMCTTSMLCPEHLMYRLQPIQSPSIKEVESLGYPTHVLQISEIVNPLVCVSDLDLDTGSGLAIIALCLGWFPRHRLTQANNGLLSVCTAQVIHQTTRKSSGRHEKVWISLSNILSNHIHFIKPRGPSPFHCCLASQAHFSAGLGTRVLLFQFLVYSIPKAIGHESRLESLELPTSVSRDGVNNSLRSETK